MKELINAWKAVDRNVLAALLSVIPGMGHLYKHHYLSGLCLLVVGNTLMVFVAVLMALGTFGVSLILVPAIWFASVAYSAYMTTDEHGHHPWLHVWEYRWSDWRRRLLRH